MPEHTPPPLDLDRLTRLATEDPQAFEAERRRLIDELIDSAPERQQQRLRGLQWKVDTVRERAGTPLAACLKISSMMWERITEPGGLLDAYQALQNPNATDSPLNGPRERAKLLDFRRRDESD